MMTKIGNTTPVYSMDKVPSYSPQQHQIGDANTFEITDRGTDQVNLSVFKPSEQLIAGELIYDYYSGEAGDSIESYYALEVFNKINANENFGWFKDDKIALESIQKAIKDPKFEDTLVLANRAAIRNELVRLEKIAKENGSKDGTLSLEQFKRAYNAWDGSFFKEYGWNNNPREQQEAKGRKY